MRFITDGALEFRIPLLILLILVVFFILKGIKNNTDKNSNLIKEISLFALFFGVLCFVIGWIEALGVMERANEIAPQVLAGGMKYSLLEPTFGMVIFLIGRLGLIGLAIKKK